ncbi:hypothetical protein ASG90_01575 [Nocardioides sp. Soil797]|nr:hypothetical protein ASG90_01575 [Nocardioides sp. Soil797]
MTALITAPSAQDLDAALREAGGLSDDSRVREVAARPLGAGQLADSFRVELQYAGPSGPASVFVKMPSSDADSAATAARIGAYERECRFYRDLLPRLDVRTPRLLGLVTGDDGDPGLVLEDLSGRTRPLDQLRDGTVEQARSVAAQLAGLQAPFWDEEEAVGGAGLFYNRIDDHIEGLAERYLISWDKHSETVGAGLDAAQREMVLRFGEKVLDWAATVTGPRTLVHQDLRLDNLLWGEGGAWLVDWQTLAWTTPAWDLAFYLGSALEPEPRRQIERELVQRHVDALHERGVRGWSHEAAWVEHRRLSGSVLLAMVAALGFVQPTERGFTMFASLVQRGAQLAIDHDVLSFT